MDSSTLHSKRWFPKRACQLTLVALLAWLGCAVYAVRFNPEVALASCGEKIKSAWAEKMTKEHGAKIVVYGGSSCAFSIDGERMLKKYNLPTVNDGRNASIGPRVLTEATLRHLRRGDTLIVALEPAGLTAPIPQTSTASQFSLVEGHTEWVVNPRLGVGGINWFQFAAGLRPGGYFTFTMLGKFAMRKSSYRYKAEDIHPSGWSETSVRVPIHGPPDHGESLSEDAKEMFGRLRDWCKTNDVRVAYSLPWGYTPAEKVETFRKQNAHFLIQMAAYFPVLKDGRLGANSKREDFADTPLHLSVPAAEVRTDELSQQILKWDVWSIPELQALEK